MNNSRVACGTWVYGVRGGYKFVKYSNWSNHWWDFHFKIIYVYIK